MGFFRTTFAAAAVGLFAALPASAVTFVLDFDTTPKSDIFGETTGTFDDTPFGFSASMTRNDVIQGVLAAVEDHFHGYVTTDIDVNSPLTAGFELDIDFQIGTTGSPPSGSDFWHIAIGPDANGVSGLYGKACLACVRTSYGVANLFGLPVGSIVGSIFTNSIAQAAFHASTDQELINLIAGTTSHEIAHTLALGHAGAMAANPGASAWGVMGSGATSMPTDQRVLEREFTYANYNQLISAVGLREVEAATVPLPASLVLLISGLGALRLTSRMRKAAA